jgi:hypothetical protein
MRYNEKGAQERPNSSNRPFTERKDKPNRAEIQAKICLVCPRWTVCPGFTQAVKCIKNGGRPDEY